MAGASELDKAVDKLINREKGWAEFKRAPAVGARPGAVTSGRPSATGSSGDLVEPDYDARVWWPEYTVETTDGMFAYVFQDVREITFDDGRKLKLDERPPA